MIRLEKFGKEDFNQLIEWIDTEELLIHWAGNLFRFPLTPERLDWYIQDTNEAGADAFIYKAVDTTTGESVGHISLGGLSYKNRAARISRVFVARTGEGICRKMVTAVLKIGFGELKLHRISLGVYNDNPAAVKCYERCGFKIEGTNRDILRYKNDWWSMIEMGILEEEFRSMSIA